MKCKKCDKEVTTPHRRFIYTCVDCVHERMRGLGTKSKKHGMRGTRFYKVWENMKTRCLYRKHKAFKRYGGRGIMFCDRWAKFDNFMEDMYASYIAHSKKHGEKDTTLNRIDNNKGYEKKNCDWQTYKKQNHNRAIS